MRLLQKGLVVLAAALIGAPAFALTVEQLKADLAKHPEANWVAGESSIAGQFSGKGTPFGVPMEYRLRHSLSLRPELLKTKPGLPASFDWRNVNGVNWLSPITNQGHCGSCVAFASVGMLEGQYNIAGKTPGFNVRFSQQDLFGRIGSCDFGSTPDESLDVMQSNGVPDEACAPYTMGRTGADVDPSASCADVATRAVKISSYASVSTGDIKTALQNGPILATMTVYDDLLYYQSGVYKHVSGDVAGGHAVVIVGYDDAVNAWIVRNSWGTEWGENGYFRIAYNDDSGVGSDNYAITVSSDNFIKLAAPAALQATAGTLALTAQNPRNATLSNYSYTLTPQGTDGAAHQGQIDAQTMQASVDTTQLADGVYVLEAKADNAGGASRPWYQVIEVANTPQTITMTLAPDFDNTKPVADRVYFKLHVDQGAVPLTSAVMTIKSADGKINTTQTYYSPGPDSMPGFRTRDFPNGAYTLSIAGQIGDLQSFQGNSLTVNVKN